MQIYEITNGRNMQEVFAPGGVLPQAGLFLGGVGKHLAKAMIPAGGNTDAAPGASVAPGQASGAAAAASAPAVAALAKTLQAQWSDTVTQMMQQAKNPATGRAGVQSIKDIQPIEIERALVDLINTNLQRMSGRQVSDYKDAASQVDQDANQGQLRNMVGDMSANIDKAIDAMLITEPTRTNGKKLADLWGSIAKMSYGIANEVEFNPVSGKAAAANANTDPNAADPQLAQAAQRAGLTAQQLKITTKVPQQRDPAVNKVLASMGLLQGAPQQQQMAVAEAKK